METKWIAGRLADILKQRGMSMRKVSTAAGMDPSTVRNIIIRRTQNVSTETLRKLLNVLEIKEADFLLGTGAASHDSPVLSSARVPLYGDIPAGNTTWLEGKSSPEEWVEPPPGTNRKDLFALRVSGQSMMPRYRPDDVVYLEPLDIRLGVKDPKNPAPILTFERLNGRVVAAVIDNEATLKQLQVVRLSSAKDYELRLNPFNPEFKPIVIGPNNVVRFQGVAVKTVRDER